MKAQGRSILLDDIPEPVRRFWDILLVLEARAEGLRSRLAGMRPAHGLRLVTGGARLDEAEHLSLLADFEVARDAFLIRWEVAAGIEPRAGFFTREGRHR